MANQHAQDRAHSADMAAARNAVAAAQADAAHAANIERLDEECIAILKTALAEMEASRDECHARTLRIAVQRDEYKAAASKAADALMDAYGEIDDLKDEITRLKNRITELEKINAQYF